MKRVMPWTFWDLYKMVVRVNIYIFKGYFQGPSQTIYVGPHAEHFFFLFFAHKGKAASLGYSHASKSQLSSDCLISFVKSVSASPIFHSVVSPPRCSIPTIRLIITNKSSQRGSWELDSLHSSALPQPPTLQLPIQIEIVTEVPGDMVQWASCLCLELAIQWTSGWCAMQYVVLNSTLYLLQLQASRRKYCPGIWTTCIFACRTSIFFRIMTPIAIHNSNWKVFNIGPG